MKYGMLGETNLEVSQVGLGTVEIGLPYGIGLPDPPPDDECVRLLHAALERGVTYFDTAAGYGRSEELVGKAFSGMGASRPVIATKVKLRPSASGPQLEGAELAEHVCDSVAASLAKMRVDSLDLVQVYVEEDTFAREEISAPLLEVVESLTARGQVRFWGATSYGPSDARAVVGQGKPFQTIQVAYNLLDRTLEHQVLPDCRERRMGVVLRSVFLQGVLSHRTESYPPNMEPLKQSARKAAALAGEYGISLSECALRFAAFGPAQADVTLFGTFSEAELEQNLAVVAAGPLQEELEKKLAPLAMDGSVLLYPHTWGLPHAFK